MKFRYRGLDSWGKNVSGFVEADSENSALKQLRQKGIYATSLEKVSERSFSIQKFFKGYSLSELAVIFRTLSILTSSGISVEESLESVAEQEENETLKGILRTTLGFLKEGSSLSEAFQRAGFDDKIAITLIKAGEIGGSLPSIFEKISSIYEKKSRNISAFMSVLIYPAVIFFMSLLVLIFMISYVVPKIVKIYKRMKANLPLPTKLVIASSNFFRAHFVAIVIIFAFLALMAHRYKRNNRLKWDGKILKIPLLGKLKLLSSASIFFFCLSSLLESGTTLVNALEYSKGTFNNIYLERKIEKVIKAITEGESFWLSFKKELGHLLPNFTYQLLKAGESGGELARVSKKISFIFEQELEIFLKNLTGVLEPAIILMVGSVIGFVIFSLMLPIAQLSAVR